MGCRALGSDDLGAHSYGAAVWWGGSSGVNVVSSVVGDACSLQRWNAQEDVARGGGDKSLGQSSMLMLAGVFWSEGRAADWKHL